MMSSEVSTENKKEEGELEDGEINIEDSQEPEKIEQKEIQDAKNSITNNKKHKKQLKKKKQRQEKSVQEYAESTPQKFFSTSYKKQPCEHFRKGACQRGENCTYSHDFVPEKIKRICRFLLRNDCNKNAACPFSHDLNKYPCRYLCGQGICQNRERCPFSHEPITSMQQLQEFMDENYDFLLAEQKRVGQTNLGNDFTQFMLKREALHHLQQQEHFARGQPLMPLIHPPPPLSQPPPPPPPPPPPSTYQNPAFSPQQVFHPPTHNTQPSPFLNSLYQNTVFPQQAPQQQQQHPQLQQQQQHPQPQQQPQHPQPQQQPQHPQPQQQPQHPQPQQQHLQPQQQQPHPQPQHPQLQHPQPQHPQPQHLQPQHPQPQHPQPQHPQPHQQHPQPHQQHPQPLQQHPQPLQQQHQQPQQQHPQPQPFAVQTQLPLFPLQQLQGYQQSPYTNHQQPLFQKNIFTQQPPFAQYHSQGLPRPQQLSQIPPPPPPPPPSPPALSSSSPPPPPPPPAYQAGQQWNAAPTNMRQQQQQLMQPYTPPQGQHMSLGQMHLNDNFAQNSFQPTFTQMQYIPPPSLLPNNLQGRQMIQPVQLPISNRIQPQNKVISPPKEPITPVGSTAEIQPGTPLKGKRKHASIKQNIIEDLERKKLALQKRQSSEVPVRVEQEQKNNPPNQQQSAQYLSEAKEQQLLEKLFRETAMRDSAAEGSEFASLVRFARDGYKEQQKTKPSQMQSEISSNGLEQENLNCLDSLLQQLDYDGAQNKGLIMFQKNQNQLTRLEQKELLEKSNILINQLVMLVQK